METAHLRLDGSSSFILCTLFRLDLCIWSSLLQEEASRVMAEHGTAL